ncbi:hypothetical protein [Haliangium sp.]|uniref:hypothetical protein n=1 Tax=Haliangium sp. TaxID=2663208 RepID=UPI003D0BB0FD
MVFGLFSKERALQRTIKKASNKLAQSPERWAAMEKLRDDGSDEALFHLFRRFSFAYSKMVEDEQEKEWVVETMVAKGQACLPAMRRYMKADSTTTIAWPLRILERVAGSDQILELIDELLADEDPGYTRDTTKRVQIIDWLRDWQDGDSEAIVARVRPYLADFDETVRFAAVEAISHHPVAAAAEPLVAALVREDEESGRLRVRIAEVLADAKLDLCGRKKEISPLFEDVLSDFRLQKDKLVRKK